MRDTSIVHTTPNSLASPERAKPIFRAVSNLFFALVGVYGVSVSGLLLLRMLFAERWGFIGLFDSFAHLLMIPALPLVVLCLLLRRRGSALVQILPAIVFLASYGSFFIARPVHATSKASEITVLTYNLYKGNQALDGVVKNIRESGPDVIALQELSPQIATGLQVILSGDYPYQALHPDVEGGFSGLGLLSRYPILADEYRNIGLGQQRVELDMNGIRMFVYNVHPPHPLGGLNYNGAERAEAISAALDRATNDTGSVLVLGDFNMTDQTPDYQRVTDHFRDSYREVGWGMGFTFPDFTKMLGINFLPPLARIDYIFHNTAFQALEAHVQSNSGGSDHRPLFARLELRPPA